MKTPNLNHKNYSLTDNLYINSMVSILRKHGITNGDYAVGGYADDKVCLEKVNSAWTVYNGDRGRAFGVKEFDSTYRACLWMIKKLSDSTEVERVMADEFKEQTDSFHKVIEVKTHSIKKAPMIAVAKKAAYRSTVKRSKVKKNRRRAEIK